MSRTSGTPVSEGMRRRLSEIDVHHEVSRRRQDSERERESSVLRSREGPGEMNDYSVRGPVEGENREERDYNQRTACWIKQRSKKSTTCLILF